MLTLMAETLAIRRLSLNRLLISNHSDIAQRYWRAGNLRESKGSHENGAACRRHYFHPSPPLPASLGEKRDKNFSASRTEWGGIEVRRLRADGRRQTLCYDAFGEKLIFTCVKASTPYLGR